MGDPGGGRGENGGRTRTTGVRPGHRDRGEGKHSTWETGGAMVQAPALSFESGRDVIEAAASRSLFQGWRTRYERGTRRILPESADTRGEVRLIFDALCSSSSPCHVEVTWVQRLKKRRGWRQFDFWAPPGHVSGDRSMRGKAGPRCGGGKYHSGIPLAKAAVSFEKSGTASMPGINPCHLCPRPREAEPNRVQRSPPNLAPFA